jgi:carbonic anhydrase
MGHTQCGDIIGAICNVKLGNLTQTLSNLKPAVYEVKGFKSKKRKADNEKFVQAVAEENVKLNVQAITERSTIMKDLVDKGELKVVGAMYDISTGKVEFYL